MQSSTIIINDGDGDDDDDDCWAGGYIRWRGRDDGCDDNRDYDCDDDGDDDCDDGKSIKASSPTGLWPTYAANRPLPANILSHFESFPWKYFHFHFLSNFE